MAARTEKFFTAHFKPGTKTVDVVEERGYVRSYGNVKSGNQITVGIYRQGRNWRIVEKLSGLLIWEGKCLLNEAFQYCQDDDRIDRIFTIIDTAQKYGQPGNKVYDCIQAIRQMASL